MSLFKREPRTVYRVYGEDEYFGHEQPPAEDGSPVVEHARSDEEPPLAPADAGSQWEPAPLAYRAPARDLRPLAVGLLAAAVIGVLGLIAVATLGRSSSRAPRAAAATATAPGSDGVRGGGATRSVDEPGSEGATRARARVRARVTMATRPTTAASRVGRTRSGRSRAGSSQARARKAFAGVGPASVSLPGARPAAVAPVPAGLAGAGGEADAATPASQVTAEFGFER